MNMARTVYFNRFVPVLLTAYCFNVVAFFYNYCLFLSFLHCDGFLLIAVLKKKKMFLCQSGIYDCFFFCSHFFLQLSCPHVGEAKKIFHSGGQ